jgi:hypothetical protein
MSKPPDEPQFNIGENRSRPGLVTVAVGSGQHIYNVTPERADELAAQLAEAADAARAAGGLAG